MSKKSNKDRLYVLGMFPYPSGSGLHVGHVRVYTAVDVMARYFRMKGKKVLQPVGWDAFGLPAENAAIREEKNPKEMVPKNEENFKRQFKDLKIEFDWEREFSTTDPTYFGITQWLFLQIYQARDEEGRRLVYRDEVPINWCPSCKTGLANEEVLGDGTHERCGEKVEKKMLPQWVMRITSYADRLLEGLDEGQEELGGEGLDWPEGILEMQRNWIGRKEGAKVKFEITNPKLQKEEKSLEVFTTRLDTIYGTSFMAVSPEIVKGWIEVGWEAGEKVSEYVEEALKKTELVRQEEAGEKTGVKLEDVWAVNPFTEERIPVYVADYVLQDVGTGAVMGVPGHDVRDFEFAKEKGLEVREVVCDEKGGGLEEGEVYTEDGVLVESGKYTSMRSGKAREKMLEDLEEMGEGEKDVSYHLRDWIFSRQRYWGEPVPLVYCANCAKTAGNNKSQKTNNKQNTSQEFQIVKRDGKKYAVVPLPEEELPLELPDLSAYEPTKTGESPLSKVDDWVETKCPRCGGKAERETDTMPNWAGSSWYFLAFPFWDKDVEGIIEKYKEEDDEPYRKFWEEKVAGKVAEWLPVDWYLGGAEHAVLHLLYARFWVKVFYDLGMVGFVEPFLRLRSVGMVLAEDGTKMSKSKGNVVNPSKVVEEYGVDAVRLYEMFMGPWNQATAWDSEALVGMRRFLGRLEKTLKDEEKVGKESSSRVRGKLYEVLQEVEKGIEEQKFNTAIASCMEFLNLLREEGERICREDARAYVRVVFPFVPGLARKLWKELGEQGSIDEAGWVRLDESYKQARGEKEIVVQVDGKVRGRVRVEAGKAEDKEYVVSRALEQESVGKYVGEGEYERVVFVEGKLVNFVTE